MSLRTKVKGIYIVPELFKLLNTSLEHVATNYKVYADRLKQTVLLDVIISNESKVGYTYYNNNLYDDQVLYFTTNIKLSDDSWCGESPLTRVVLRQDQFSSNGIIVTPVVTIDREGVTGNFNIILSDFIRYDGDSSSLESTSYRIVEEITGTVVFDRENDRTNLQSIYVPENTLQPNKMYRIDARYRDAVGRYSNYGSLLYTANNVLYSMFKDDVVTAMYGSVLVLSNSLLEYIPTDEIRAIIYRDGIEVGSSIYDNKCILIDTKAFEVGDELVVELEYGVYRRAISLFIKKLSIIEPVDNNLVHDNVFNVITIPIGFISTSGISEEFRDGYIYSMSTTGDLYRYKFNSITNEIVDYSSIATYSGLTGISNYRQRIFENPIDGNIVIYSTPTSVVSSNPHYLIVLNKFTLDVIMIDSIVLAADGVTHQGQPIVIDTSLYLFNAYNTTNILQKTCYKLDLLTYRKTLVGNITFPSVTSNEHSIASVVGLTPILRNGLIYFISLGGYNSTDYTSSKNIYELDIKNTLTPTVKSTTSITTGIKGGRDASILTTLKNGKVALILAEHTSRNKKGIMYIDIDSGVVGEDIDTVVSTLNLNQVVVLNDGTYLFLNGVTGVRFN